MPWPQAGDAGGANRALWSRGILHLYQGDHEQAGDCARALIQAAGRTGDRRSQVQALGLLGGISLHRRDLAGAVAYHRQEPLRRSEKDGSIR